MDKLKPHHITLILWFIIGAVWIFNGYTSKNPELIGVGSIIWCLVSLKTVRNKGDD